MYLKNDKYQSLVYLNT